MLWIVFGAFCHCPASKSTAVDFLHSSLSMGPCKIPADRFSKQTVQGECAPRALQAGHHTPILLAQCSPIFSKHSAPQPKARHSPFLCCGGSFLWEWRQIPFRQNSFCVLCFSLFHFFLLHGSKCPQAAPAPSGEQAAHCRAQNPFFVVQRKGTAVLKAGNMLLSFCPKAPPRTPSVEQACALCQCMGRFAAP